jgi:acetyl-CoA carboxylase alpha subunit
MAKVILEFEKPIVELEQKIAEMRELGQQIDISKE